MDSVRVLWLRVSAAGDGALVIILLPQIRDSNKKGPPAGPADGPWNPKVFMPSSEPAVPDADVAYNNKYRHSRKHAARIMNDLLSKINRHFSSWSRPHRRCWKAINYGWDLSIIFYAHA